MKLSSDSTVAPVYQSYPRDVRERLQALRTLIITTAEQAGVKHLEETLKWGEPSFLAKHGSTVRIDWKAKNPEYYAIYFKCTSKLVPTFKRLFPYDFRYEGDRAIRFDLNEELPSEKLAICIRLALTYHKVKHLPLLGA